MKLRLPSLALLIAIATPVFADVKLPAVIGDGMVLQQSARVHLWGWAEPGEAVSVDASWGAKGSAVADIHGEWKVELRTRQAFTMAKSGTHPETITIAGHNTITLKDVLIGEVWVCSGQSNMEMQAGPNGAYHTGDQAWAEEAPKANRPGIRLFDVENNPTSTPQKDVRGTWQVCTTDTADRFSATGYFFGVHLQEVLDVPIGLVSSDYGGTPAEAWTSVDGLRRLPDFAAAVKAYDSAPQDPAEALKAYQKSLSDWEVKIDAAGPDPKSNWAAADFDDSRWDDAKVPGNLANLDKRDGISWIRRSFEVPAELAGKEATLNLGAVDDMDWTYINGTLVGRMIGSGVYNMPRAYHVPAGVLKAGRNVIAVRVLDTGGPGGITAPTGLPVLAVRDQAIVLGGVWKTHEGADISALPMAPVNPTETNAGAPASLFNGMIAPLTPMAIRGAIWYQGEGNVGRAEQYSRLFPEMITSWRKAFGEGDFPFYFVQIAPFTYRGGENLSLLREAQEAALFKLGSTGMAVTVDIGNATDIHPRNKREVGRRLALVALAKTYMQTGFEYSGPSFHGFTAKGGQMRVTFDHADGLTTSDGKPPTCFEVAGADGKFFPATAKIEGKDVVLDCPSVALPLAVRFSWGETDMPNLINSAKLPASPFRFPGVKHGS